MKYTLENNTLTLCPEGNIDTASAPVVEKEMQAVMADQTFDTLIVDLDKVAYVSSAGLRVFLRLKKTNASTSIVNANADVYGVLEMTGFTEMMSVSKAYRNLDITGCEVIGEGSNGIVYRYQDDIIVKVYKNNDALEDIHRERELARTALILGVNTAISYDVVKVGDKYGSVFELINSQSITKLILADPDNMPKYVKIFVDLLKEVHGTDVEEGVLPSARQQYLKYADFLKDYLTEDRYQKLVAMINAVPESNKMIHGDYHTNNVHYANGEAILIDMDTLSVGNPCFEFASIYLAYNGFNELHAGSSKEFLKLDDDICKVIFEEILKDYFETEDPAELHKHEAAIRILAYTRLLRRTIRRESDNAEGIAMLNDKLSALIDTGADLAF